MNTSRLDSSRLDSSRIEEIGDLSKLKVAELKQQLKIRGLAVTGNKTELVERLQEAIGKDGAEGMEGAGVDDEEFDEEEILGGDDVEEDIGKITPQEEAAALAGSIRIKKSKLLIDSSDKKKISLKRTQPTLDTSEAQSIPTLGDAPVETEIIPNSASTDDKENTLEEVEPKHKVIKLSDTTTADAEGVLEARAKKFGVTAEASADVAKAARASRFGITDSNRKPSKLSMETGDLDVDKLKKRAERFGEVTSKNLSKLETVEKIKKRQERFGEATKPASKVIEKVTKTSEVKKTANGTTPTPITAPVADEDAAKLKRAERFAAVKS